MSTCQEIIDRGFGKSAAARPDTQVAPQQLIDRVGQCLREVFQVISREMPTILGVRAQVAFDAGVGGWPRPVNSLRVIEVRADAGTVAAPAIAPGSRLVVVPYDDALFAQGRPSLTELGQAFVPVGQAIDPTGGTVVIVHARAPNVPTQLGDAIDPFFPTVFDDFLQYDIAGFLATNDKRAEDEQSFLAFKSGILQQIIEWARQQTYKIEQRFPGVTAPLANTAGGRQQPTKQQP